MEVPGASIIQLILLIIYLSSASSIKSSAYLSPTGGFLLPHPEFEQQHGIPLPQHFLNLRTTRSIKDAKQREKLLDETLVRVKRTPEPQFSIPKVRGKVGIGGSGSGNVPQVGAGGSLGLDVGVPKVGAGGSVNLGVPQIGAGGSFGTPGIGVGGSLGVPQIGAGANIGAEGSLGVPQIGAGANIGVPQIGAGGSLGIRQVGAGGSLNLEVPKIEAGGSIGTPQINGDLGSLPNLQLPQGNVAFDGNIVPNIAAGADLPKFKGELGLGNLEGSLKSGAELKAELGGLGVGGDLKIPDLNENIKLGAANIPSISSNLDGELSGPKLEVPNAKLELGAVPIPSLGAEIGLQNLGLNPSQRQRGEKAASIRKDELNKNALTSSSPTPIPSDDAPSGPEPSETSETEDTITTTAEKAEATTVKDEEEQQTTIIPEEPLVTTTTTETPVEDVTVRGGELYLPENYNILEIPRPNYGKLYGLDLPGPLPCVVFLNILGVGDFNEIEEKIAFDADLTVEWIDGNIFDITTLLTQKKSNGTKEKIRKSGKTLSPQFLKKIWRPDLYFENLISVEQPTITNKAVLSLKYNTYTGFFSYTVRMTITVQCPMHFQYYPADTQICEFRIGSYSHGDQEMQLKWLELSNRKGVNLQDDSENNFDLKIHYVEEEKYRAAFNNPLNETHDILTFAISGRRKISYHLIQTYLPSIFHIFITWLVFLIPYTMYDLRIGTTMTTLLTLTAMFSAVRESAPVVNYIKGIDLWMLACVFFVFLNLVELTLMTWMRVTVDTLEESLEKLETLDEEAGTGTRKKKRMSSSSDADSTDSYTAEKNERRAKKLSKIFNTFQKYSFYAFAGMFVLFNIVYWVWLLTASEYLAWEPSEDKEQEF